MNEDLNRLLIPADHSHEAQIDHSTTSADGTTMVYFRELERHLVHQIRGSQAVVGCVAWLMSEPILDALATVRGGVSIVVQKEDFLRPDSGSSSANRPRLRDRYDSLHTLPDRFSLGGLVGSLSQCGDPGIEAVRCVGNHNREKKPAFPRMHNKFLVFCDTRSQETDYGDWTQLVPRAVWTGSFNMTRNATRSFENAIVLTDRAIVAAYYREWEQILSLSEPLDWESDWCAPEWRIGT